MMHMAGKAVEAVLSLPTLPTLISKPAAGL